MTETDGLQFALSYLLDGIEEDLTGVTLLNFAADDCVDARELARMGFNVIAVDHTHRGMEGQIAFIESDLWELPEGLEGDFSYCDGGLTEVPEELVQKALKSIRTAVARRALFVLSTDKAGWWFKNMRKHWTSVMSHPLGTDHFIFVCA